MDIWRGYSLERIANTQTAIATGPAAAAVVTALNAKSLVSAILQTTGVAVAGASQLAALSGGYISNVKAINDIGGAGVATSVSPTTIDSSSYSYTRQLQTEDEEQALDRPIYVTVTDIEEGLNRVKVVERESVF